MAGTYEEVMAKLMAQGWKPGDPVPEELINASAGVDVAPPLGGAGTMEDPMQLSTMMVQGDPQGGAPQAQTNPGGVVPQAGQSQAPPGVFESMNDEDSQMYAGMGELRAQKEAAQAMRDTGDAEGKYVNQGRTFVAASPLEHLVVGAKRYKGKKDVKDIGGKQTKGRKSLIDLLRNKKDTVDTETLIDGPNGSTGFFDYEEEEEGLA
jgi:hypothetical protein